EVPGPGSGSLYDLGSHLIDQALQLFGRPHKIFADLRISRPISRVVDYFEILCYYPDFRVRIQSSYSVREPLPGYIFHGLKGSFLKPKTNVQEEALTEGQHPGGPDWGTEPLSDRGLLHTERDGSVVREYLVSARGDYGQFYKEMYEAIRNGGPSPVSAAEGREVIELIEAAYLSNETSKVVEL
ncbi:MAG: oxidoreductase, partial [Bacteroidota bacterium]|nr:oxidoreductase [Bacteroidota bacterium]